MIIFFPNAIGMVGGIDWNLEAIQSIQKGQMTASMGGHFMEGGWVMVLLYDYFNGVDFVDEGVAMKSKMSAITQANADQFEMFRKKE